MSEEPRIFPFFKGRVALHAILRAAGIGPGDQVLMPGYTCVVVPNAVNYTGAQPVYLDIDAATYNLDCNKLEDGLGTRWEAGRAKAIIVQHTYGIPCDMDRIGAFARKHGLLVIEDSCHALGSRWNGQLVGTFGDAAFFSSQWSKPVTTGLGGWAVINNREILPAFRTAYAGYAPPGPGTGLMLELQYLAFTLLNRPRLYSNIQRAYRKFGDLGLAIGSSSSAELACELPSRYLRGMHGLQKRRLHRLLDGIEPVIADRRLRAAWIEETLREADIPTAHRPAGADIVFLRYPLRVSDKTGTLAKARRDRVMIGDWFLSPIHPNLEKWHLADYEPGTCPVAEMVAREVINIPTDPRMTRGEITRTVGFIAGCARSASHD
jgi:perosamine synthetase